MTDDKHSLKIKTKWFEVSAQGRDAIIALVLLGALGASGRALGWW